MRFMLKNIMVRSEHRQVGIMENYGFGGVGQLGGRSNGILKKLAKFVIMSGRHMGRSMLGVVEQMGGRKNGGTPAL